MGKNIIFSLLKDTFNVMDPFSKKLQIRFSWDNRCCSSIQSLARLDRCYTFNLRGPETSSHGLHHKGRLLILEFDHSPITLMLHLATPTTYKSSYKMSNFYLSETEVKVAVERTWNHNSNKGFTAKLRLVVKFYKVNCTKKAEDRREAELALRHNLKNAQASLHRDSQNQIVQERSTPSLINLQH